MPNYLVDSMKKIDSEIFGHLTGVLVKIGANGPDEVTPIFFKTM